MSSSVTYTSIFSVQNAIIGPAITFGLTLFVAGFYALLYGLSTYFLIKRRGLELSKRVPLMWTTALFFISNLGALTKASNYIVDATYYYEAMKTQDLKPFVAYSSSGKSLTAMLALTFVSYIIANCIADAILIHRCYILYGYKKAFLGVLVFLSFSTNAIGVIATAMRLKGRTSNLLDQSNWALFVNGTNLHVGYFCANAGFNGCLTLILAGRIWWMGRQGRESLGLGTGQRYRAVAAIILESGMMYPIILIVQAILTEKTDTIGVPIDFTPIATREEPPAPANGPGSNASTGACQCLLRFRCHMNKGRRDLSSQVILMAGIAPTMINVRISIGRSIETTLYQDSTVRRGSELCSSESLKAKHSDIESSQSVVEK